MAKRKEQAQTGLPAYNYNSLAIDPFLYDAMVQAREEDLGLLDKLGYSAQAIAEGAQFIPGQVADTISGIVNNGDIDVTDKEAIAEHIADQQRLNEYRKKYEGKAFSGITGAMSSAGTSLAVTAPALVGTAFGPLGNVVGAGATGAAAYRSSKHQFMQDALAKYIETTGQLPNQEEWDAYSKEIEDLAQQYGAWEAIPEAAGSFVFGKLIGPLGKNIFKPLGEAGNAATTQTIKDKIVSAGKRLGLAHAEEQTTETITGYGQSNIEAELGLRERGSTVGEAFAEQAPSTFWLTNIMGGGAIATRNVYDRLQAKGILGGQTTNLVGGQNQNNNPPSNNQSSNNQSNISNQNSVNLNQKWGALSEDEWNAEAAKRDGIPVEVAFGDDIFNSAGVVGGNPNVTEIKTPQSWRDDVFGSDIIDSAGVVSALPNAKILTSQNPNESTQVPTRNGSVFNGFVRIPLGNHGEETLVNMTRESDGNILISFMNSNDNSIKQVRATGAEANLPEDQLVNLAYQKMQEQNNAGAPAGTSTDISTDIFTDTQNNIQTGQQNNTIQLTPEDINNLENGLNNATIDIDENELNYAINSLLPIIQNARNTGQITQTDLDNLNSFIQNANASNGVSSDAKRFAEQQGGSNNGSNDVNSSLNSGSGLTSDKNSSGNIGTGQQNNLVQVSPDEINNYRKKLNDLIDYSLLDEGDFLYTTNELIPLIDEAQKTGNIDSKRYEEIKNLTDEYNKFFPERNGQNTTEGNNDGVSEDAKRLAEQNSNKGAEQGTSGQTGTNVQETGNNNIQEEEEEKVDPKFVVNGINFTNNNDKATDRQVANYTDADIENQKMLARNFGFSENSDVGNENFHKNFGNVINSLVKAGRNKEAKDIINSYLDGRRNGTMHQGMRNSDMIGKRKANLVSPTKADKNRASKVASDAEALNKEMNDAYFEGRNLRKSATMFEDENAGFLKALSDLGRNDLYDNIVRSFYNGQSSVSNTRKNKVNKNKKKNQNRTETQEKPETKAEEKTEEKAEQKAEEKTEEKTEQKTEGKTEEKIEEKVEERVKTQTETNKTQTETNKPQEKKKLSSMKKSEMLDELPESEREAYKSKTRNEVMKRVKEHREEAKRQEEASKKQETKQTEQTEQTKGQTKKQTKKQTKQSEEQTKKPTEQTKQTEQTEQTKQTEQTEKPTEKQTEQTKEESQENTQEASQVAQEKEQEEAQAKEQEAEQKKDELMASLPEKPSGSLPPRRATRQRVQLTHLKNLAKKLKDVFKNVSSKIEAVQSFTDLPEDVQKGLQNKYGKEQAASIEGVYDPRTDTTYLVADNITDLARAIEVWGHENVGHHGIAAFWPNKAERSRAMNNLFARSHAAESEIAKTIRDRYRREGKEVSNAELMEEIIAHLAGKKTMQRLTAQERTIWERIIEAIKNAFNKMIERFSGNKGSITSGEVEDLLNRLTKNATQEKRAEHIEESAVTDELMASFRLSDLFENDQGNRTFLGKVIDRLFYVRTNEELAEAALDSRDIDQVIAKDDLGIMMSNLALPSTIAKVFPQFRTIFNIQINRAQDKSKAIRRSLEECPSIFGKNRLSKEDMKSLEDAAWEMDGKKYKEEYAIDKLVEDGQSSTGKKYLKINDKYYAIFDDIVDKHIKQNDRVRAALKEIRRSLDNDFIKVYNKLADMPGVNQNDIDEYRRDYGAVNNYFPHVRKGNYFFSVLKKGHLKYREHFDALNNRDAEIKAKALRKKYEKGNNDPDLKFEFGEVMDMPEDVMNSPLDSSAMTQVIKEAASRFDPDMQEEIVKVLVKGTADLVKARGFMRHAIHRKNIPGFQKEDLAGILFDYKTGLHGWLTKIDAARQFGEELGNISARETPQLYTYAKNYVHDMLRNSDATDRMVNNIKAFFFMKYLGAVIKTAVVNATQNPVVGLPRLGNDIPSGRVGLLLRGSMDAIKQMVTQGKHLKGDEAQLIKDLIDEGVADDRFNREIQGQIQNNTPIVGTFSNAANKIIKVLGAPMGLVEKFNRTSLALAAYRAAVSGNMRNESKNKYGIIDKATYEQAKIFATDVVNDSHFIYGKQNMTPMFRGDSKLGRSLGSAYTFRSFSHNLMDIYLHELSRGNIRFLTESIGTSAALGGLMGIPLFGTLSSLYTALSGDDEDLMGKLKKSKWLKNHDLMRDLVCYGLPSLGGINLGGSLMMDTPIKESLNKASNLQEFFGLTAWQLSGIPGAEVMSASRAIENFKKENYLQSVESVLPNFMANIAKAYRLHTEGQTGSYGQPLENGQKLSLAMAFARALGFQPLQMSKSWDEYQAGKLADKVRSREIDRLVLMEREAVRKISKTKHAEMLKEIRAWNKRMEKEEKPYMMISEKDVSRRLKRRMNPVKPNARIKGYKESLQK